MGRERQFTESEVLDAATDVFAAHGYQATSLSMLLQATGLGKQSLYNAFGDKRELYLKALECAVSRFAARQTAMRSSANGRESLGLFFRQLLNQCTSADPARKTCMVCSGLLEDMHDPDIRRRLLDKWSASHEVLRAAVETGQKDGSIVNPLPSASLADLLMSLMSGMRVLARADVGDERVAEVARLGLSILDRP